MSSFGAELSASSFFVIPVEAVSSRKEQFVIIGERFYTGHIYIYTLPVTKTDCDKAPSVLVGIDNGSNCNGPIPNCYQI